MVAKKAKTANGKKKGPSRKNAILLPASQPPRKDLGQAAVDSFTGGIDMSSKLLGYRRACSFFPVGELEEPPIVIIPLSANNEPGTFPYPLPSKDPLVSQSIGQDGDTLAGAMTAYGYNP